MLFRYVKQERERERRSKYSLSHIPQIPWPVTCTLHSKQSLSALLLNMSIKVGEGGKYLKLARRLGGVSSFGIYSNSTVLAFLIYYTQSVLYVIQKICVLCITIVLTQNSCYKINCVHFCETSISSIIIYVTNIYLKIIMKLKHV